MSVHHPNLPHYIERIAGLFRGPNGVDDVGWKRLRRLAAFSLTLGLVSGCGGAALTAPAPGSNSSVPTATAAASRTMSVGYCQLLDDGEWVTNDSATSTTPCVPDPSYATGDEQVDASVAVPRCYTCKLSDWNRAERRAAVRTGQDPSTSRTVATVTGTAGRNEWSPDARTSFISDCTVYMDGSLCQCLANHLQWQVASDQAQALTGQDPRVQLAARECRS